MNVAKYQHLRLQHGAHVTRRRIFIILTLKSLMLDSTKGRLQDFCNKMKDQLRIDPQTHWLLGNNIVCRMSYV